MSETLTASSIPLPDLPVLDETERSCLQRYLDVLVESLGPGLVEVSYSGRLRAANRWPRGMPIRSDLDLLVVTDTPLSEDVMARLLDATLPLFLESGRQIGPQFRTRKGLPEPKGERAAEFVEQLCRDAIPLFKRQDVR